MASARGSTGRRRPAVAGERDGVKLTIFQLPSADSLAGWATYSIGHVWGMGRDFVLTVMSFASPTKAVGVSTTEDASRIATRALAHG